MVYAFPRPYFPMTGAGKRSGNDLAVGPREWDLFVESYLEIGV